MNPEFGPGPEFLKEKYDLHNSPEVESAATRTEHRTGELLPNDAELKIQNYIDRIKEITEREKPDERERLIGKLKDILHDKYVIKPEEIPEGYYENQQRLARELGYGDVEIGQEQREQLADVIVTDQKSTLDSWTDYLSSNDATYPDWLKYWAFRSVLSIGGYDKERHAFSKRSKGTTKPFADINREALAYVIDAVEKKYEGREIKNLQGDERTEFEKLLNSENFSKLYAWAIEKVTPASIEQISITEGRWIKFPQGTDPTTYIPEGFDKPLVSSLQGHGTGWCTAGESTAKTQLQNGDFYVYYSIDQEGKPIIPRSAIRMQGNEIGEVRGIAPEQNLDPYIADIVDQKLQEFPDGKAYEKKNADMKHLTFIDRKVKSNQELNKDDLVFLYEINSKIEGFGYQRDPRIEELRNQRDPKIDAPIVMECQPEEIAFSEDQISDNTKAYIGKLYPGIFTQLANLEHIYTSFPEGKVSRSELEIGGKNAQQLEQNLIGRKINISGYAKEMLHSADFTTMPSPEQIDMIRLKVGDLGFMQSPTTDQLYARAIELGLELCPPEVGVYQRLKDENQSMGDYYRIAMKQIVGRYGYSYVFHLCRYDDGLWLSHYWAKPDDKWSLDDEFVFRFRKVSQES